MTAEEIFQHENGFGAIPDNVNITLTKRDIYRAMEAYASQQRTEGIREGFEAARDVLCECKVWNCEGSEKKYPTADDYLNSK